MRRPSPPRRRRWGQRRLAEHVLARGERRLDHLAVQARAGDHVDEVDLGIGAQGGVAHVRSRAEPPGHLLGGVGVRGRHRHQLDVGQLRVDGQVRACGVARADDPDSQSHTAAVACSSAGRTSAAKSSIASSTAAWSGPVG